MRSVKIAWWLFRLWLAFATLWLLSRILPKRMSAALWKKAHPLAARSLRTGMAAHGGLFIKAGQMMSSLGSFLPAVYEAELSLLQDRGNTRSLAELSPRLDATLGPDAANRRFASFDEKPLASASLAQVHRAQDEQGRALVVKILHPHLEEQVRGDLRMIKAFIPLYRPIFPVKNTIRAVKQLEEMLEGEMDLKREANNLLRARRLFSDFSDVHLPLPILELSGSGVLTMTFEEGLPLNRWDAPDEKSGNHIATIIAKIYLRMIFEEKWFHADPHPGNLLIRNNTDVVLLDFGAAETLPDKLSRGLRTVISGAIKKDSDQVLAGIEEMGFIAPDGDKDLIKKLARDYMKVLASLNISDYRNLGGDTAKKLSGVDQTRGKLRRIVSSIEYPDGYFYLERTLILLFGMLAKLSPNKGLPGIASPLFGKMLMREMIQEAAKLKAAEASSSE